MAGLPPGDVLLPVLNQSLVDFERKGEFNRLLGQLNGRRYRSSRHLQKPLIVVAALIVLFAAYWFLTTRNRGLLWRTLDRKKHIEESPRNRAFAKRNNVVALQTLAREFFVELGITRFVEQDNYPRVALAPSAGEKSQTETQIRELWDLANGSCRTTWQKAEQKNSNYYGSRTKPV